MVGWHTTFWMMMKLITNLKFIYMGLKGILDSVNIRKVYTKIPSKNFILFLREAEMCYIMRDLTYKEKEKKNLEISEYLYNTVNFDLYDLEELEDVFAYDY